MVCLGNICRSPIAEAVFQDEIKKRGLDNVWFTDSAATSGYHTGSLPDSRARKTIQAHAVEYSHHARTLDEEDFKTFEFILGMDNQNVKDIKAEAPKGSRTKIEMLGTYDPEDPSEIRDPYYDRGSQGFEECFIRCSRAVKAFLDKHS